MKYGLLVYEENKRNFNIGDYIQSLAAKQFLPKVDTFINREMLGYYRGERTKMILNGWFTHNAKYWIPIKDIVPFFISFHINHTAAPLVLAEKGIAYLKQYEPIGCRDNYTLSLLKDQGIAAYFSGCLTLTLDSFRVKESERGEDIYIVDPLYGYPTKEKIFFNHKRFLRGMQNGTIFQLGKRWKHIEKIIDDELLVNAIFINQVLPANTYDEEQKFEIAKLLLEKYASAKLVITSRIHCALPCLALGTPVIFLNGFETFVDSCRLDGILELFNRVDVNIKSGQFTSNFNLEGKINSKTIICNSDYYKVLAMEMKEKCKVFIAQSDLS
jgi:hypothetical protein